MCLKSWPHSHPTPLNPELLNHKTFDARHQFADVFERLLCTRDLSEQSEDEAHSIHENRLASELQALVLSNIDRLHALSRHSEYSRHIIGTEGEWVGYICRWEKQTASAIHGHPSFAYYQVLEGDFQMDLYNRAEGEIVTHDHSFSMTPGHAIWQKGPRASYDNLIHKVSTLDTPGFTLHLFSENPSRGRHFYTA